MSWREQASCAGSATNIYFDIYEENPQVRSSIDNMCINCPVNRRCFAEGVSSQEYGVWGGVYLEEGHPSIEFNNHKTPGQWTEVWQALTMES